MLAFLDEVYFRNGIESNRQLQSHEHAYDHLISSFDNETTTPRSSHDGTTLTKQRRWISFKWLYCRTGFDSDMNVSASC